MDIVGPDGEKYAVKPAKKADAYELFHQGTLAAGFTLEPERTPAWVSPSYKGKLPESSVVQIANEFVDRGGASMRML